MRNKIWVLDTTLRDGEQAPGYGMRMAEKIEIAKQLECLGVDIIEAGFPAASNDDFTAVKEIAGIIKSCAVTGLCRALKSDIDRTWEAVRDAEFPMIHIFLATSDIHLEHKLRMDRKKLLETAVEAVSYAAGLCPNVQFTAEDATRTDTGFLAEVFLAVEKSGATVINIADTVGFTTPDEISMLCKDIRALLNHDTRLGVHCHNDLGMATANTVAAIKAGANQFDATIAGIGERAGMAALEEVVMALKTRNISGAEIGINTKEFLKAGKLLSKSIDLSIMPHKPIIGDNAFAHEAGVHQHGIMSNPLTYEIMKPEDVGIHINRMVMGKHSGKAALKERLEQLGYSPGPKELEQIFSDFKELCDRKKSINDADLRQLVIGEVRQHQYYSLSGFVVNSGTHLTATAVVRLFHDGTEYEHVARGETPVIAAFNAVDKIIKHSFPLHHFTIQSISEGRTELCESMVQVLYGEKIITGRGLNTDIVEACIHAYLSAINKALSEKY